MDAPDQIGRSQLLHQFDRRPARVAVHQGNIDIPDFQRGGKGKNKQLDQRRHDQHETALRVAQHAEQLLDDLRLQTLKRRRKG